MGLARSSLSPGRAVCSHSGACWAHECLESSEADFVTVPLEPPRTGWLRVVQVPLSSRAHQLTGSASVFDFRQADGRKVLRSSIREFLCSEAMFHLGVPTTRAGACVTSESTVVRDVFYDGNPKREQCAVVLRIAPTFIR